MMNIRPLMFAVLAAMVLPIQAAAQEPACRTACVYGAVLQHLQTTTDRPLAMARAVSTHDACAADPGACGASLGFHDPRVIDLLLERNLIATSYEIAGDSIVWHRPGDPSAPPAMIRFAPLEPVQQFDRSLLPDDAEALAGRDAAVSEGATWYRVGAVVNIGDDTRSYWYWVRQMPDGSCEAVYAMVTGMV